MSAGDFIQLHSTKQLPLHSIIEQINPVNDGRLMIERHLIPPAD